MATSKKTSIAYTDELSVNLRISRYKPESLGCLLLSEGLTTDYASQS